MADQRYIKGVPELQKFMEQVPTNIQKNIMRGALRAGMNVIRPVAQGNINSRSGELARGLKVRTRENGNVVSAALAATGKHGFVARWLEYGTASHVIKATKGRLLFFGGLFRKTVMHPGSSPKPFMRPAMDSQSTASVNAAGEYIQQKMTTKQGLETSQMPSEGDEP